MSFLSFDHKLCPTAGMSVPQNQWSLQNILKTKHNKNPFHSVEEIPKHLHEEVVGDGECGGLSFLLGRAQIASFHHILPQASYKLKKSVTLLISAGHHTHMLLCLNLWLLPYCLFCRGGAPCKVCKAATLASINLCYNAYKALDNAREPVCCVYCLLC